MVRIHVGIHGHVATESHEDKRGLTAMLFPDVCATAQAMQN